MSARTRTTASQQAKPPLPLLAHVTLLTGHVRHSPRGEVTDDTMILMTSWLADQGVRPVRTGQVHHAPIPNFPGYTAKMKANGRCLAATVGHEIFGDMLKIWVAPTLLDGAKAWLLHGYKRTQQPPAPWCVVKLLPAFESLIRHEDVSWLGDFERCLAWAWIEMLATRFSGDSDSDGSAFAITKGAAIAAGVRLAEQPFTAHTSFPRASNTGHELGTNSTGPILQHDPGLISVANAGPDIADTNFWFTDHAARGLCFLSSNAGTLRLLVPQAAERFLPEMLTGRSVTIEGSIVQVNAWDIVFDDGTPSPFCISVDPKMMDRGLQPGRCVFTIWTKAGKVAEFACTIRA